jgi:hypothetical protein
MQLKLFILPVKNLDAAEGEMNGFLRSHRVLAVKKEFVADGENSFWTFCVEYLDSTAGAASWPGKGPKVDYKEVLKPEEFEVFSRLREWRGGGGEGGRCWYPRRQSSPLGAHVSDNLFNRSVILRCGLGAGSGCAPAGWRTVLA